MFAPNGLYRVDYSYSEAASGNGSVKFDTMISDYFLLKAGTGSPSYVLGIPLDYGTYDLITAGSSIKFIDDLQVDSDYIDIDWRGQTIDLTGFNGSIILFGNKTVTVDTQRFPALNAPAKLIFSNINSSYKILRDGVECPTTICSVISYSSKRLTFSVTGFSTYSVQEIVNNTPTPNPTPTSTQSSSGSSGGIVFLGNSSVVPVKNPSENQPSQQTSSSGSASTPQPSSQTTENQQQNQQVKPVPQIINKEPVATNLNPDKDKKKVVVGIFAVVGMINLMMAIFLLRRERK